MTAGVVVRLQYERSKRLSVVGKIPKMIRAKMAPRPKTVSSKNTPPKNNLSKTALSHHIGLMLFPPLK